MQQEYGVPRADSKSCECQQQAYTPKNEGNSIKKKINHQIITAMKVEIESIVCNCADELKIGGQRESQIPHILIRVINAITLSANKEELRTDIKQIAEETELDKFFVYGYGKHHFWLTHLKLSNGEPMEHRLLMAKF